LQISYRVTNNLLNHTEGYIYKQGKILVLLRYDFRSDTVCLTPGEYLRYHRIFQGLSTRELARRVGVVPTTLKQYERRSIPIRYETALALANELNIDYHRLLNDYTVFIDYPFTQLLREIRNQFGLTRMQFATEIGVTQSTYVKWEQGIRRPRRQEYKQIMVAIKRLEMELESITI